MARANVVAPVMMDGLDLLWLEKAVQGDEFGWTAPLVFEEILMNRAQFWALSDGAQGAIITTVEACPKGKFLSVWFIAGEGFIRGAKKILADVAEGARNVGCFGLYGIARTKAQAEMYVRFFGAEKLGTNILVRI